MEPSSAGHDGHLGAAPGEQPRALRAAVCALSKSHWPSVSYARREGRNMKNKIIVVAIALVAVFLAGFVPQYVKAKRLENELRQSRQENAGAQLRDLIGLAYVQTNQKNFGLGAETTIRFFSRVRELANQTPDASSRKALEDLLALRERITAELAKGDEYDIGPCSVRVGLMVGMRHIQDLRRSLRYRPLQCSVPSPSLDRIATIDLTL
jgi:hypothetical protein